MTTLRPVILKCPHCGTLMSDYELMSYTVHEAVLWSDGKNDTGISNEREIKICALCRLPFWKTEATLPDDPGWDVADKLGDALDIRDQLDPFDDGWQEFKIQFYSRLISEDFAGNEDQETYLRTRMWWAVNDLVRYLSRWYHARNLKHLRFIIKHRKENLRLFRKYKDLAIENLNRLIFLYIKKGDVDLLYLADMYREKRDFRKAMDILLKVEKRGAVYSQLKHKISRKNERVFRLK